MEALVQGSEKRKDIHEEEIKNVWQCKYFSTEQKVEPLRDLSSEKDSHSERGLVRPRRMSRCGY